MTKQKKQTKGSGGKGEMKKSEIVEMKVPCKSEYVGVIRLAASGIANRMRFSYDDIQEIKAAIGEACINCVQHAYPQEEEKNIIIIRFVLASNCLEIMVKDRGKGISPEIVKRRINSKGEKRKEKPELGIFIMKSLMDSVDYNLSVSKGTEVRMKKSLKR